MFNVINIVKSKHFKIKSTKINKIIIAKKFEKFKKFQQENKYNNIKLGRWNAEKKPMEKLMEKGYYF